MEELNKEQIKKANKLLELLCKSGSLGNEKILSFFDYKDEAETICSLLEKKDLLSLMEADQGIIQVSKNNNTCNAFENNLLLKEFNKQKRNILNSKFGIILSIVSIVSILLNMTLGVWSFQLKANLSVVENRDASLRISLDSMQVENKLLTDKLKDCTTELQLLQAK